MLNKIRYGLSNIRTMIGIFKEDKETSLKPSGKLRRLSLLNGYASDKAILYGYNKDTIHRFVSDYHRNKARRINKDSLAVFDNKLLTERVLSPFVKMPESYYLLQKGKVTSLSPDSVKDVELNELPAFIKQKGKVVFKPVSGGGGKGVQVVTYNEAANNYDVNNETKSEAELIAFMKELNFYLITEFIQQGSFGDSLFAESTNTIRIITMVDAKTNQPFIAGAAHRIGTEQTKPTDNFGGGKGGISVLIDTETGMMEHAVRLNAQGEKEIITDHPDNHQPLVGMKVPHWEHIKQSLLKTIVKNPYLKYVGWDVVVTDDGFAVIEINSYSGLVVLQVHKPFKDFDERIEAFYKDNNIL